MPKAAAIATGRHSVTPLERSAKHVFAGIADRARDRVDIGTARRQSAGRLAKAGFLDESGGRDAEALFEGTRELANTEERSSREHVD